MRQKEEGLKGQAMLGYTARPHHKRKQKWPNDEESLQSLLKKTEAGGLVAEGCLGYTATSASSYDIA